MGRVHKPWRRESVGGAWYVTVDGKKIHLLPAEATLKQAKAAMHRVLAAHGQGQTVRGDLKVREVVGLFLAHRKGKVERGELSPTAMRDAIRFLKPFMKARGETLTANLKPAHVSAWLDTHPSWGSTTRNNAVTCLKSMLNWARKQGHIASNTLADAEKPRAKRRELVPTTAQVESAIREAGHPAFADLLRALWWTGCRPNEIYTLTADRVDLENGVWRVLNKTRGRTGVKYRVVHLSPDAIELSRRLVAEHPEGVVFRNRAGKAWTSKAAVMRFLRLQEKLGYGGELSAYGLRHLFATDALVRGVDVATVAELMGHTDTKMVSRVYSKLGQRPKHLKDAVAKVRPSSGENPPPTPE